MKTRQVLAMSCAAAFAACLFGCGQTITPPSSVPSAGTEQLASQSAPSAAEMTEKEILQLAADLTARGQTLEDYAAAPSLWELDKSDSFFEEVSGQRFVFYRVASLTDKAQVAQALREVFSETYTDALMEELFRTDIALSLRERYGKLYVCEEWFSRALSPYQYTGKFTLIGCAEDVISLQAELSCESGAVQKYEDLPLTLRREDGRWALDGWKLEARADNSFVQLPAELEQLAQQSPELSAPLRYAWTLGSALKNGEQRWVDWCFTGLFQPPAGSQEQGYSLQDISGLKVSDFKIETSPDNAIYLLLDVADPGSTPLRTGPNWYLLTFGRGISRSDVVTLQMYPDSEQAAFGLGKDASDEQVITLSQELTAVADLFHNWACAGEADADWWETSNDALPAEIPYVAVRMTQDGRTDVEGRFTAEEFEQAAREYLNAPKYKADPDRLRQRCFEQDGRFGLMGMGGFTTDIGLVCRDLGGGLAGGTATVVRRYYKDDLGLVPDYDLVYTLQRSLGGEGSWYVYSCTKQPVS